MSNAALYQYYGLRNAGVCYANLLQWNIKNGTAVQGQTGKWYPTTFPSQDELSGGAFDTLCPPILTTATGGSVSAPPTSSTLTSCATYAVLPGAQGGSGSCYDGNSLVPYYAAAGGLPELGSAVLTNLLLCDSTDPSLTWFQVGPANAGNAAGLTEGDWALTCGNWAPVGGSGWSKFPDSQPPASWSYPPQSYACPQSALPAYCLNAPANFWGPFYAPQGPPSVEMEGDNDVVAYTFSTFTIPSRFPHPTQGTFYVPSATTIPLNIGGPNATTQVSVTSPECVSLGATGAQLLGCTLSFDPVQLISASSNQKVAETGLATVGLQLPTNAAANTSAGGMFLPLTVGAAAGMNVLVSKNPDVYYCKNGCTLLEVWLPSNTNVAEVGFSAAPSTIDPTTYQWSQGGYITVADGSCWNIDVGRTNNNQGTISFNQVTPGSACAN